MCCIAVPYCPEGWSGNLYLPYCYRLFTELLSYADAGLACERRGATLTPVGSNFANGIANSLVVSAMETNEGMYHELTMMKTRKY